MTRHGTEVPGCLKWPRLIQGTLIARYKRFLADIRLRNGHIVTAHCPNSGSMLTCSEPGQTVYLSRHENPKRKLKYTWEMIKMPTSLVGVNTLTPDMGWSGVKACYFTPATAWAMLKQNPPIFSKAESRSTRIRLGSTVQMPLWIALYSAIYASIELRGAAFLPFWITDLSVPDALFRFKTVTLPIFGKLTSFNLLPLMMGVAFYLQQKLMPKPAAATASPQAAQQQKMMMIMMPIMFPLMLYKAPSGLNLYIMASTFAGVIEQFVIRKHIREKEQDESKGMVAVTKKTGGKIKKKKPKPFYRQF